MSPAQQSALQMSLNPHQLLEYILFAIKGVARGYGNQKKTSLMTRKERAEQKLRHATIIHDDLNEGAYIRCGASCTRKERLTPVTPISGHSSE